MSEFANLPLNSWQDFYTIVGSSGGALIGLQFVVIALVADTAHSKRHDSINAFATPTIVHFSQALAISALMCAPWPSMTGVSVVLTICGLAGLVYTAIVFRRARKQQGYKPVMEDWLWYFIFPAILYLILTVAPLLLEAHAQLALFTIAAVALALLFVGIHNAWDSVMYIVVTKPEQQQGE